MDAAESWRFLFENWPAEMPREGMILTTFDEMIPFKDFLVSGGILLVERDKPDSVGARKVMIGYNAISAIKIASITDLAQFEMMGFQSPR